MSPASYLRYLSGKSLSTGASLLFLLWPLFLGRKGQEEREEEVRRCWVLCLCGTLSRLQIDSLVKLVFIMVKIIKSNGEGKS